MKQDKPALNRCGAEILYLLSKVDELYSTVQKLFSVSEENVAASMFCVVFALDFFFFFF